MKETEYRSPLPPEEVKRRLIMETVVENELHKKTYKIVLRWKSEWKFTIRTEDTYRSDGGYTYGGVDIHQKGLSFGGGYRWGSKTTMFSNVFHGKLVPTEDGSAIRGRFRLLPLVWALCVGVGGIFLLIGCLVEELRWELFGTLCCLFVLIRAMFDLGRSPGDPELLDLIVYLIRDPDEPAPLCDGAKPDDDIKE